MNPIRLTILVSMYSGYIVLATFYPFEFSKDLWNSLGQGFAGFFEWPSLKDFIENVLLFVPFGFLLYYRRTSVTRKVLIISLAAIAGGAFSLAVELAQMGFPGRDPSAFDVLANTLGAGCGAELAALWPSRTMDLAYRYLAGVEKAGIFMCMAILLAAWPLVVSAAQWIAPFGIWNSQYSLQIANEATLDRPWLGKIHFVGLYNRALSAEEVKNNFNQRHELRSIQERLPAGLISVYTFSEGQGNIAHDLFGA